MVALPVGLLGVRGGPSLLHPSWWLRGCHLKWPKGDEPGTLSGADLELDCFLWEPKNRGSTWTCALSAGQDDKNHKVLVKEIRVKYHVHRSGDPMCIDVNSP